MGTAASLIQFFLNNMSLNSIVKFAVTFSIDSCERSCRSNALAQLLFYWDIVVSIHLQLAFSVATLRGRPEITFNRAISMITAFEELVQVFG